MGAFIYGSSHSGWAASAGAISALFGIVAAARNNGDMHKPAMSELPMIGKGFTSSDQVLARRFMKWASLCYAAGAAVKGNFGPASAHSLAAGGNAILENGDKERQKVALELE